MDYQRKRYFNDNQTSQMRTHKNKNNKNNITKRRSKSVVAGYPSWLFLSGICYIVLLVVNSRCLVAGWSTPNRLQRSVSQHAKPPPRSVGGVSSARSSTSSSLLSRLAAASLDYSLYWPRYDYSNEDTTVESSNNNNNKKPYQQQSHHGGLFRRILSTLWNRPSSRLSETAAPTTTTAVDTAGARTTTTSTVPLTTTTTTSVEETYQQYRLSCEEGSWVAYLDGAHTGLVYYYNTETHESQWRPPTLTFPSIATALEEDPALQQIVHEKHNEFFQTVLLLSLHQSIVLDRKRKEARQRLPLSAAAASADLDVSPFGHWTNQEVRKTVLQLMETTWLQYLLYKRQDPLPSQQQQQQHHQTATATTIDDNGLLARDGDWAAYLYNDAESKNSYVFFFNEKTGVSQWEPPPETTLTDQFPSVDTTNNDNNNNNTVPDNENVSDDTDKNENENDDDNNEEDEDEDEDEEDQYRVLATEGDWCAYFDAEVSAQIYYVNEVTGERRWEPPTDTFPNIYLTFRQRLRMKGRQKQYRKWRQEQISKYKTAALAASSSTPKALTSSTTRQLDPSLGSLYFASSTPDEMEQQKQKFQGGEKEASDALVVPALQRTRGFMTILFGENWLTELIDYFIEESALFLETLLEYIFTPTVQPEPAPMMIASSTSASDLPLFPTTETMKQEQLEKIPQPPKKEEEQQKRLELPRWFANPLEEEENRKKATNSTTDTKE